MRAFPLLFQADAPLQILVSLFHAPSILRSCPVSPAPFPRTRLRQNSPPVCERFSRFFHEFYHRTRKVHPDTPRLSSSRKNPGVCVAARNVTSCASALSMLKKLSFDLQNFYLLRKRFMLFFFPRIYANQLETRVPTRGAPCALRPLSRFLSRLRLVEIAASRH